jgi:ketosteroid isomerase-like protein
MDEREEFLHWFNTAVRDAEEALHNGDAEPRMRLWTRHAPVTVLGAWKSATGPAEVVELFESLGATFADCTSYEYEPIAVDVIGDVAYTVGLEHTQASINGRPTTYTLRATQIYRREDGTWKVVHRHGDTLATTAED